MMMIAEFILLLVWLLILPIMLGLMFFPAYAAGGRDRAGYRNRADSRNRPADTDSDRKKPGISGMIWCLLSGTVLMWAVFELIAVPGLLGHMRFSTAVGLWLASLAAILIVYSLTTRRLPLCRDVSLRAPDVRSFFRRHTRGMTLLTWILLAAVICSVGYQVCMYIFGSYMDADDSRFVAEATEAFQQNTILEMNPATGVQSRDWSEITKDMPSPWTIWLALLSRLSCIHPAIFSHTVYAPWLLLLFYAIVFLGGQRLFQNDKNKVLLFELVASVCMMFFAGSSRTAGEFTLHRIWQGKATVAGVGIPLLMLELLILYQTAEVRRKKNDTVPWKGSFLVQHPFRAWLILFLTDAGCCLMSGMGVILAALLIGVGGLWYLLAYRRIRPVLAMAAACIPSAICGVLSVWLTSAGVS
ncbi:MAG: DUF6077 domain-containing protein [Bilifractor sp.]|jgi:hypothetical protein